EQEQEQEHRQMNEPVSASIKPEGPGLPEMLEKWRSAWCSKDIRIYMDFYSPEFQSGKRDYAGLKNYKEDNFERTNSIEVAIRNIEIDESGDTAVIKFQQFYRSDYYHDVGVKTLRLKKEDGKWKILSETWEPLS
ncbi:MAG: nuclear transport factor 2 family protein, partial [Desulfobulbaceae bacterium]|nr:nuclear transport factor 2 family protein [Desulfobulbaceae bacterium]